MYILYIQNPFILLNTNQYLLLPTQFTATFIYILFSLSLSRFLCFFRMCVCVRASMDIYFLVGRYASQHVKEYINKRQIVCVQVYVCSEQQTH